MATSSASSSVFLPPSPPDSLPCSPRRIVQRRGLPRRLTTYSAYDRTAVTAAALPAENNDFDVPLTPVTRRPRLTHPGCTTIKYNRRTNPELERRRTHFCHFAGTFTKVHLKTCFPYNTPHYCISARHCRSLLHLGWL